MKSKLVEYDFQNYNQGVEEEMSIQETKEGEKVIHNYNCFCGKKNHYENCVKELRKRGSINE
jgi:hypothetical protein